MNTQKKSVIMKKAIQPKKKKKNLALENKLLDEAKKNYVGVAIVLKHRYKMGPPLWKKKKKKI